MVRVFIQRTAHAARSAIFNALVSSSNLFVKLLLALQPFRFTVNDIKVEENVGADKPSRITWPVAMPQAVEIVKLPDEFEPDSDAEESDSDLEEDGEECFQEESSRQAEVVLIAIEMLRENQHGYSLDCQSLGKWVHATASPTWDELQASCPYLRVFAQQMERRAEVDEMLVLREEIDETNRAILPTSLIEEVIEDAHQRPGGAQEGAKNLSERLLH